MSSEIKYTLKQTLSEKFGGIIWKIETDNKEPIIAVETRYLETHTAVFSAFNFVTGESLFRELHIEGNWNRGLDRITKGIIFLHGYTAASGPEHKGITALSLKGQILWEQFNKTLYDVSEEGLVVYNPLLQPRSFQLLDPFTGETLQPQMKIFDPVKRNIVAPEFIHGEQLASLYPYETISGPISHASFKGKHCYSFHLKNGSTYTQKLVVYQENTKMHDEILEEDIQKLNPEAFFIEHDHLFCIRNKKQEIVSYLL